MYTRYFNSTASFASLIVLAGASVFAEDTDYVRDVFPVLQKYCISCHTEDEAQGGLVMESFAALMRGGESGPAITPGVPTSSRLVLMASGKLEPVMPPDDADGPNDEELALIANWIEQGAKGPAGEIAMRRELLTPSIKASEDADFPITAIAVSSTGSHRAIARFSEVVLDGESKSGPIESQPGKVNSLRFSKDGKRLLVASGVTGLYGRAAIYDVETGKQLTAVEGHDDVIQVAIFSPNETLIATASYDREIMLWDAATAKPLRRFSGHNGAIYSLAFSPDGKVLVSGCADETVKVWDVDTGVRLDTMSQPQGEVLAVAVTGDGQFVIAGSADNRLRVWRLLSRDSARINPLVATRFVDESPLTNLALTADGTRVVVVSEAGNVKVLRTSDWTQLALLDPLGDTASDLALSSDGRLASISLMNGETVTRSLPSEHADAKLVASSTARLAPIYLDLGALPLIDKAKLQEQERIDVDGVVGGAVPVPRGCEVNIAIDENGQANWYAFTARAGEMWVIETDTTGLNSKLDSIIELRDAEAQPLVQTRLQAVRDSYFTFRGKNSTQNDDFRIFAWEEMKLGEYLYASGEVTRLWMAPRGADSGFNVFPGRGNRWTYFGSSGTVHALGEPAYIVRALKAGEEPVANGLPIFDVHYLNDDDPSQSRGKDSYVLAKIPADGRYLVQVRDTRGEGGSNYVGRLRIRPANPSFAARVSPIKAPLRRGSGREVELVIERVDGYDGEVWFELENLPPGLHSNFPVRVQPGQSFAVGNIWADSDAPDFAGKISPRVTAHAEINGRNVERAAGFIGELAIKQRPQATIEILPDPANESQSANPAGDQWVIQIKRGETISLLVKADREDGFKAEIPLGKETAGRDLPHGVYVDNIGLNGLLVRESESERKFFLTADPIAELGRRQFFLRGEIEGNITSKPVMLEVLP